MGLKNIFEPSSIAIVGASKNKEKVGYAILKNILDGGYRGKIYPVNPKYDEIEGLKVYKSVEELPDGIDLAIIVVPIQIVPKIMEELGKKGIKGAVVISAGGRETGEKGRRLEEEIIKVARRYGIRFLGPNCFGFINTRLKLNANFGSVMPLEGDTAFISQSGALFAAILDWAIEENIGFSYCVSIGNMADIEFGELISYLGKQDNVKRILIYMESLHDAKKFVKYTKDISKNIPVVITKAGRTEFGIKAAMSHTGALGGKDFLYSACFKRLGAVRADTVELMFDLTEGLSKQPVPNGNRFAILTNAGGPGVLATDRFGYWGIQPASLSEETIKKLNEILPPAWSKGNPVDILGDATPQRYKQALKILLEAKEVDGIIGIMTPQFMTQPYETAKEIVSLLKEHPAKKPFYFALIGGERLKEAREFLEKSSIATYETPEEAVDCMILSWKFHYLTDLIKNDNVFNVPENRQLSQGIIGSYLKEKKYVLPVYDAKRILEIYSIPVNKSVLVKTEEEIETLIKDLEFPVVLKVQSPDILHKTEAGGVILNIQSKDQLYKAYRQIIKNVHGYKPDAKIEGVIVEEMVEKGFELILGSSRDRIFKQYIIFGLGGTYVEFFKDVSFDFPPLTKNFAEEMIKSTKVYKLLKKGFRDIPPANLQKLEEVLIRFSYILKENPEIEELEINPLIVSGDKIFAVDARAKLTENIEDHLIFEV